MTMSRSIARTWPAFFLSLALFAGCSNSPSGPVGGMGGMNGNDGGPPASPVCGDGIVDGTEMCDDGTLNGTNGDPCGPACNWTCTIDAQCDNSNPCSGMKTCSNHVCKTGAPPADGTSCGTGKICHNGACGNVACGDGIVDGTEECDDGGNNGMAGDGCDHNCKWVCVPGDMTRNCTPMDSCAGQGTCDATHHTCTAGTPLHDGTACPGGMYNYCKNGVCTMGSCGDGNANEPNKQCDDGASNGHPGDGCTTMCTFACVNPATDCGTPPVCQKESCGANHACAAIPDPAKDGTSCGSNLVCKMGLCTSPTAVCGDGNPNEPGKDCDLGAGNNVPGSGCVNCKFECTLNPNSCDDGNLCSGTKTCTASTVMGQTVQKCVIGASQPDGTFCGTNPNKHCINKVCQVSQCSDGVLDPRPPLNEQCTPPDGVTCDSMCQKIVCGDGKRDGKEQCDDGNTVNLDGCDSMCMFEQDQRVNQLKMQFNTDGDCSPNQLGAAISGVAQGTLQMSLDNGIKDGSVSIVYKMLGLTDLAGGTGPANIGIMHATPVMATGYDGTNDLEWWYTTDPMSIDAMRNPLQVLTSSGITNHKISAMGPVVTLTISLAGATAHLTMEQVRLLAFTAVTPTKPGTSTNMMTPGHLASENLDPNLTSFPSTGGSAGVDKICGNITAESLSQVPAPMALLMGGTKCTEGYTNANHLLDILVGGCTVAPFIIPITAISKTQPDTPGGDTYVFALDNTHTVASCTKNGQPGVLADCLKNATYSSYFQFTSDRVILK